MANPNGEHACIGGIPAEGSWWEYDARGVPLCRVCDVCRKEKLSHYRPEILRGYTQDDVNEPIEPAEPDYDDDWDYGCP
jgi:hypothetical protein